MKYKLFFIFIFFLHLTENNLKACIIIYHSNNNLALHWKAMALTKTIIIVENKETCTEQKENFFICQDNKVYFRIFVNLNYFDLNQYIVQILGICERPNIG